MAYGLKWAILKKRPKGKNTSGNAKLTPPPPNLTAWAPRNWGPGAFRSAFGPFGARRLGFGVADDSLNISSHGNSATWPGGKKKGASMSAQREVSGFTASSNAQVAMSQTALQWAGAPVAASDRHPSIPFWSE